ncbi:hypothetical protein LZ30DRAFT_775259 [Colletotrichum cereale]|nr:hypothetical protein LZ30DRAFT_775259 [Colletotrichum cereale]
MIASGNLIAEFRKNEVQQLEEMLVEFEATQHHAVSGLNTNTGLQTSVQTEAWDSISQDALPGYTEIAEDKSSQAEDLTTQQIIDVVSSLEWEDNEWDVSHHDWRGSVTAWVSTLQIIVQVSFRRRRLNYYDGVPIGIRNSRLFPSSNPCLL